MSLSAIIRFLFLLSLTGFAVGQTEAINFQQRNEELSQQISQFLEAWLIKQNRTQARKFLSPSPIVCFSADKDIRTQAAMKQAFSSVLLQANNELGKRVSLSDAIEAFKLGDQKTYGEIEHSDKAAYSISVIPVDSLATYLCKTDVATLRQRGIDAQHLYLVSFSFKVPEDKKGGLLFVWAKEKKRWHILTFDALSF